MKFRNLVAALTIAIAVIAGLVGFTQCGKADLARLTRADSLLVAEEGDSAMMILQSIDSTDLTRSNNAYYALLYTQAQYKCYVPIESDSLINIAVRYYTKNYDQRKLTLALMYRGAVYADLRFNRLALDSYKEAEKVADTTDLMTIGLLNFRMGELYQNNYIDNDEPITRYKKAARYFNKVGHKAFEHYSYGFLGQMYSVKNYDSAYYYINKTIDWANEQDNQKLLLNECHLHLSKLYWYYKENLEERKKLLLSIYQNGDICEISSDVFHHLADTYCKLGMIDSAKYFAAQFPQPEQLVDTMSYNMMLESLAVAQNDYKTAHNSLYIAANAAETIVRQGKAEEYYAIDKQYDNSAANAKVENLSKERMIHLTIIIIIVLTLIIFLLLWWFYRKHRKQIEIEQQQTIDFLRSEIDRKSSVEDMLSRNMNVIQNLNKTVDEKQRLEISLKSIVEDRMVVMRELLNVKHLYETHPKAFLENFNKIVLVNKKSNDQCAAIIDAANQLYGNIIDHLSVKYGNLNAEDKLLLSLSCFEFTSIEMKVLLNLGSMTAIYSARHRTSKKLGVESLGTFIDETKCQLEEQIRAAKI